MRWTSLVAIYILFWAFSVFLVLPFGVKTSGETGAPLVPGQAESAPHTFSLLRVLLRTTIVATVLFALFVANYELGWVEPSRFDWADPVGSPAPGDGAQNRAPDRP